MGVFEFWEKVHVLWKLATNVDALSFVALVYSIQFFQMSGDQFLTESYPRPGALHTSWGLFFVLISQTPDRLFKTMITVILLLLSVLNIGLGPVSNRLSASARGKKGTQTRDRIGLFRRI